MQFTIILFSGFLIAFLLSNLIIPKIIIISLRKKLYDIPDERKVHSKPISRLGGVSFFPSILFAFTFVIALCRITDNYVFDKLVYNFPEFLLFVSGLTLVYIIGTADDLVGVRYRQKFLVQIISAVLIPLSGLYINNFYGFLGIHSIPAIIGIPLTVLLIVFITNSFNLIDGIDGLASGLSLIALFIYGFLFAYNQLWSYSLLAFCTIGVILPFFYYNVFGNIEKGKKIFMGDTGSLSLGFILSFLTIKFIMFYPDSASNYTFNPIVIAFSALMVPCLDVIRVVLLRLRLKRSPFMPDRNHIHHKFLGMGFSVRKALIFILGITSIFCITNIILTYFLNCTILITIDILLWIFMHLYMDLKLSKHKSILFSN